MKAFSLVEYSLVFWMVGLFLILGAFGAMVALGLVLRGVSYRWVLLSLSLYLSIFVLIALFASKISYFLETILRDGLYLYILLPAGLFLWGLLLLLPKEIERQFSQGVTERIKGPYLLYSTLLILPCPLRLALITFSTLGVLNIFPIKPLLVGLGLGLTFVVVVLLFYFLFRSSTNSTLGKRFTLAMVMILMGLFYLLYPFSEGIIQEAKSVYKTYLYERLEVDIQNMLGVLSLLALVSIIGMVTRIGGGYK